MLRGNKGEWSEVYVFLKLLYDSKLMCWHGDGAYLDIRQIYRANSAKVEYTYTAADGTALVAKVEGTHVVVYKQELAKQTRSLLATIQAERERSFCIEGTEEYLAQLKCDVLKASCGDKKDLSMLVVDMSSGLTLRKGFSIKSELGSSPTLINASGSTNFVFRLQGFDDQKMLHANSIPAAKDRMRYIMGICPKAQCVGAASKTARDNLAWLDGNYEQLICRLLWLSWERDSRDLGELCRVLDAQDPFGRGDGYATFKIKKLLSSCALGLNLGHRWDGKHDANGGFINVASDGQVYAVHFFDHDTVEAYLLEMTRLENGSRSKHRYGDVYKEGGQYLLKLNLQVRFK